jgi:hypothetical protein
MWNIKAQKRFSKHRLPVYTSKMSRIKITQVIKKIAIFQEIGLHYSFGKHYHHIPLLNIAEMERGEETNSVLLTFYILTQNCLQ